MFFYQFVECQCFVGTDKNACTKPGAIYDPCFIISPFLQF